MFPYDDLCFLKEFAVTRMIEHTEGKHTLPGGEYLQWSYIVNSINHQLNEHNRLFVDRIKHLGHEKMLEIARQTEGR